MNAPVKITTFAAAVASVFAASLSIGAAVGPTGDDPTREEGAHSVGHDAALESTEPADAGPRGLPAGLMISQGGYALQLATTAVNLGRGRVLEFTIAGPDAIRLARRTLTTIKGNSFWAFAYNVAALPLAAAALLNALIAGAAMAFASVFVVSNSLRLRRFQAAAN